MLLAGWLVYEATAQPGLAAFAVCSKIGWPDLRTAFWLRRVDPDRWRGAVCCWFYLAYGLWKITLTAFICMFVIIFGLVLINGPAVPRRGPAPSQAALVMTATSIIGAVLSTLVTIIALIGTLRRRVRIWLGAAPTLARQHRYWPPSQTGINLANVVLFSSLMVLLLFSAIPVAGIIILLCPFFGDWAFLVLVPCYYIVVCVVVAACRDWVKRTCVATTPRECWGVQADEVVCESAARESV